MKHSITATGLLSLVATILVGTFSTGSALAGGGPNSVFLWTGALPGLVLVLSDNPQVLALSQELEFVCKHFKAHGIFSNGKAMTTKEITLVGTYTSCEAPAIGAPFEISKAEYLLGADGSLAVINKPIVITIPALGCSLKINNGGANNDLRLVLYLNRPGDVLAHVEISHLTSLGSGGFCGEAGAEKTEATLRGLLLISVDGGSIQWDPK
jgi:hypothetical protein